MNIDRSARVGELAREVPGALAIFDAARIDYCCAGDRSLQQACTDAGASIDEVVSKLEGVAATTGAERQWTAGTLNELVEFIESTHHVFTRAETERLRSLMTRVAQVHGATHPELGEVARLFAALDADLAPHLLKEEHILFPMIRSGDAYAAEGPIEVMLAEHDAVGGLLRELRAVTHDYALPSDACASYGALYEGLQALEADLHRHIHLENNVLFPLVREG